MGHTNRKPETSRPGQVRVLIVDDEAPFLKVLEEILSALDYHVIPACTVAEALEQLEQRTPDLILTDIMMPDINGYQFLDILRNKSQWGHIPVGFISALAASEDEQKALNLGAAGYLSKPFTARELQQMIVSILEKTGEPGRNKKGCF